MGVEPWEEKGARKGTGATAATRAGLGPRRTPFVDLAPLLGADLLAALPAVDEEITLGLVSVPSSYTGGSHRSMGITPPALAHEVHGDYGEVIAALGDDAFAVLASLADPDVEGNAEAWQEAARSPEARRGHTYGEERALALGPRQMRWLELRHGVYFPWKVYVELMPGGRWSEKAATTLGGRPKGFTREALLAFPRTVALVASLPFQSVGSVKLLGLTANDHGTVHRDRDPHAGGPDEFLTLCPSAARGERRKRLFVWDEATRARHEAPPVAYWFNDGDYHGVEADPWFRYSLRVDGVFEESFRRRVLAAAEDGP